MRTFSDTSPDLPARRVAIGQMTGLAERCDTLLQTPAAR
jgi:hypothetical protein